VLLALIFAGGVLVALTPPTISALAIVGVAVVLVLLSHPFGALCTLAFSVPFESVRNLHVGGLNVTTTNLIVFTIAAALVGRSATSGEISLGPAPWRAALLLYGAVLLASVSQATDYVGSIKELLKWGQLTLVYLTGVTVVKSRDQARILLAVVFLAVLSEAAVGVVQTLLHSGPSSFARGAILRSSGTFDQPNPFAGYLNMTFPLAVACLIFRVFPRKLVWLVTLVTAAGVFSSLSRGAELGSIAALMVIFAVTSPYVRRWLAMAGAVLLCVFLLAIIGIIPGAVSNPVTTTLGVANIDVTNPTPITWSAAERLAHMEAGLRMFAANPILGVGIGNYPAVYWHYRVEGPWDNPLGHAHNYFINIAAETGAIGFIAWIVLLSSGIVICVRAYRRAPDAFGRAVGLGGLGVLVAFATHMFFDDLLVHGIEAQLGLVMVLVTVGGYGTADLAADRAE
jgi:O-antigen ligase